MVAVDWLERCRVDGRRTCAERSRWYLNVLAIIARADIEDNIRSLGRGCETVRRRKNRRQKSRERKAAVTLELIGDDTWR